MLRAGTTVPSSRNVPLSAFLLMVHDSVPQGLSMLTVSVKDYLCRSKDPTDPTSPENSFCTLRYIGATVTSNKDSAEDCQCFGRLGWGCCQRTGSLVGELPLYTSIGASKLQTSWIMGRAKQGPKVLQGISLTALKTAQHH